MIRQKHVLTGMSIALAVALLAPSIASAKQYTDAKHGYTVDLPGGWSKGKPDEAGTLFVANKGKTAQWSLSAEAMQSKKEASDFQKQMMAKPKQFVKQVLTEMKKQFPDCTMKSAVKRTVGTSKGAEGMFLCTVQGKASQIGFYAFTRGKMQYSIVTFAPKSKYASLAKTLDKISESLMFTK